MLTILELCDTVEILKTFKLIRTVLLLIRIIVPIILLVSMSSSLMMMISKGDTKEILKSILPKMMAALIIFFVPLFIKLVLQTTGSTNEYYQCFENATSEGIAALKVKNANSAIETVKKNLTSISYKNAVNYINKVEDETTKQSLKEELSKLDEYVELSSEIDSLKKSYDRSKYTEVSNKISKIQDSSIKEQLEKKLSEVSTQKPISVNSGVYQGKNGSLTYYVHLPNNMTTNMPVVLYLHGDGAQNSAKNDYMYSKTVAAYGNDYPYIIISPSGGMWAETSGRLANLKSIIDEVCSTYKCDESRISVVGHSRGAIGTWAIVNNYPGFFYSAIPISCSGNISGANFIKTKVRAYCGNQGDELYYMDNMKGNVSKINKAGGTAQYIQLNSDHSGTPNLALTKETLEWLIN